LQQEDREKQTATNLFNTGESGLCRRGCYGWPHSKIQMVYVSLYVLRQLSVDLGLKMQGVKGISLNVGRHVYGRQAIPLL
jgi:hypothetical protein